MKRNAAGTIWRALKAQPAAPAISDPGEVDRLYRHWRKRVAIATFVGYVVFYLCRKNISAALPAMSAELGYSNTDLGLLGGALYVTYAIGKFVNGVFGDQANLRYFSAVGLFLSSLCCIMMGVTGSLVALAFFWGLNGWFQSMGNPPFARAMCHWFTISERGTKFGIWSTCHQVGTWIIMLTGGFIIASFGWRAIFYIPAAIGIVTAVSLVVALRDTPEAMGLPHVEKYKRDKLVDKESAREFDQETEHEGFGKIFLHQVLLNKYIWLCSFINISVYIVRFGTLDWATKFLVEEKGCTIEFASMEASMIPLFGIVGMILAGWMSDRLFKARRAPATVIFFIGTALSILAMYFVPPGWNILQSVVLGLIGFFTYGPQFLISGAAALDFGSRKAAATATGFIGTFGYAGAALSSLGSGVMIDKYSWIGGILFWAGAAAAGALLTTLMWNAKPKHM
ncbi:MAG: MFS transporter [Proteobacteria bacterium]|nr:MFS transporter [Pseudomonadota bacterium]